MNESPRLDNSIELIAEFNDSMQGSAQDVTPLQPGEGLVDVVIIGEFTDSASDSSTPGANGTGTPAQQSPQSPVVDASK